MKNTRKSTKYTPKKTCVTCKVAKVSDRNNFEINLWNKPSGLSDRCIKCWKKFRERRGMTSTMKRKVKEEAEKKLQEEQVDSGKP
jgi:hypothetical protein